MKKSALFLCAFAIGSYGVAQDIAKDFKSLQVNSAPAYVILGVEPENIQRPNSPAEFAANVQSATVNNSLATNFAMETTPYLWGKKKPDSKRFDVLNYITSDNYLQNVLRSLTFSFATSPSDDFTFGSIPRGTGLGLGAHVQLFTGKVSPKVKNNLLGWFYDSRTKVLFEGLINTLEDGSEISDMEEWVDTKMENEASLKDLPENEKESIKSLFLQKVRKKSLTPKNLASIRSARDMVAKKAKIKLSTVNAFKFPLTREGFMLELSGASARIATDAEWANMTVAKQAIWITPSYRFNVNEDPTVIDMVDIMAVARWTSNASAVDASNYLDAGGKLQWIHERFSVSVEAIYRYATVKPQDVQKNYTYRTSWTFSYKLNDLVTFKTTFGTKFDGTSVNYDEPEKMFLVGGFNFALNELTKNGE